MKVTCPSCRTNYNIDDKRIPAGGAKLKCAKCQTTFPIKPASAESVPLPGISAPEPVRPSWDHESTRVMTSFPTSVGGDGLTTPGTVPLPGGGSPAIPLPGITPQKPRQPKPADEPTRLMDGPPQDPSETMTMPGIPRAPAAIPLPGSSPRAPQRTKAPDEPTRLMDSPPPSSDTMTIPGVPRAPATAIPLPGISPQAPRRIKAPEEPTRLMDGLPEGSEALTMPGTQPPPVPLPGIPRAPSTAVPLPGSTSQAQKQARPAGEPTRLMDVHPAPSGESMTMPRAPLSPATAIPLPGITPQEPQAPRWDQESTRVLADAPPEGVDLSVSDPVPLPGSAPASPTLRMRPPPPVAPVPDNPFDDIDVGQETELGLGAPSTELTDVPLPGAAAGADPFARYSATAPMAIDDSDEAETRVRTLPLPSEAFQPGTPSLPAPEEDLGFADADLIDSRGPPDAASPSEEADFSALGAAGSPSLTASGLGAPPAPTHPARGFHMEDMLAPVREPPADFSFDDLPSPALAPPPPQAQMPDPFEAGDLPSPAGARPRSRAPPPPGEEDFSLDDLPAPAAASQDSFEVSFDNLPSPAPEGNLPSPAAAPQLDDFGLDFSEPASPPGAPPPPEPRPAVDPSASFGDVDFGAPEAPPRPVDALEFDPSAPNAPPPQDDLEADLSAPIPPPSPTQTADGLEMLNFIDEAAKDAKVPERPKVSRYHIRRRSGKVFGPFDEGVVVKMIEDGQLLGNEDISTDAEEWSPIGTVSSFAKAIEKLVESPPQAPPPSPTVEAPAEAPTKSMDRLKQLYEGRMAAVAVVDGSKTGFQLKKRLPLLIAGAVLLLLAAVGGALGATPYGAFGVKVLFPAKVAKGSPEMAHLERAQKALLSDTFKGYVEARDAAAAVLKAREYPQARAVWCQAVFYLQRRYAAASPRDVQLAKDKLADIQLLGKKHPDVVKAVAGGELAANQPAAALALLDDALARTENQADLELSFLRAEAYATKGQAKLAADALRRALEKRKDSAKALHALGNLHQANKDADQAAKYYEEALKADPNHAVSAVELAAIELLIRKDVAKGLAALEQALTKEHRELLGPAELARGLGLKAMAMQLQFKLDEAVALYEEALGQDPGSTFAKAGLAKVHLSRKEFKKAVALLKEATEKEPGNLEYTDGYLSALIGAGMMDDALKQVQSASGRFPGDARIAYLGARVDDALDHAKEAESNYIRAANADPELYEANLFLARLYLRFKRYADARAQLEQAAKKAPDIASVRVGVAELALAEGELEKAEAEFRRAVELDPSLAEAQLGLSKAALARGEPEKAREWVERALELDGSVKDGRLEKGLVLWKLGQLDQATVELEAAKAQDPRSAKVLITLGAVKVENGDLPGAEASLLAALSREPSNAEAHYYLARVKAKRAEYTQAVEYMKTALEHAQDNAEYHYQLGLIYRDARKIGEAVESWRTAVELVPHYADALEALGRADLDRGNFEGAIDYFQRALAAQPSRTHTEALMGECHFMANRWNDAISRYLKALQADPSLTWVYFKVARAYTEKGQHSQAVAWYRKATTIEPDNPTPWVHLGYAYKERGLKREAIGAFKTYLAKKPETEDKKEIEDEIYDLEHY